MSTTEQQANYLRDLNPKRQATPTFTEAELKRWELLLERILLLALDSVDPIVQDSALNVAESLLDLLSERTLGVGSPLWESSSTGAYTPPISTGSSRYTMTAEPPLVNRTQH